MSVEREILKVNPGKNKIIIINANLKEDEFQSGLEKMKAKC